MLRLVAKSKHWSLQVCGDMVGISAVVAAMLGLSVLLLTGVLTWRDCLTYPPAWDTLFWFAVLVGETFPGSALAKLLYPTSACSTASRQPKLI
jgi:Sodium:sulfate symporter transmembrane region